MQTNKKLIAASEDAAMWLSQQKSGVWAADDEVRFHHWLNMDPAHRQAYDNMVSTWQQVAHVPRPADVKRRESVRWSGWEKWLHSFRQYRYSAIAALALLGVIGAGGWYAYDHTPQYVMYVDTSVNHGSNQLALPDGSVITANRHTTLEVSYYRGRREVRLLHGEAYFDVAHKEGQTFTVVTGDTHVTVLGTVFNVRAATSATVVHVAQGAVKVSADGADKLSEPVLHAGDTVRVNRLDHTYLRGKTSIASVGAWRYGQLAFRNTNLQDVAEELSFYLEKPVTIADRRLVDQKVSGFAKTAEAEAFLQSLPLLLAVNVLQLKDGSYRIVARS